MTRDELYDGLVRLCQAYGYTPHGTYDLLHQAAASIITDPEMEEME